MFCCFCSFQHEDFFLVINLLKSNFEEMLCFKVKYMKAICFAVHRKNCEDNQMGAAV